MSTYINKILGEDNPQPNPDGGETAGPLPDKDMVVLGYKVSITPETFNDYVDAASEGKTPSTEFAIFARRDDPDDLYVWCGGMARGGYTAFVWSLKWECLMYSGERPDDDSSDGLCVLPVWQTYIPILDEYGTYLCKVVDVGDVERIQAMVPEVYRSRTPEAIDDLEDDWG